MTTMLRKRFAEKLGGEKPKEASTVAKRKKSNPSAATEEAAHPNDVLLGRGKGSYEWQGNLRYQQIICFYLPQYSAAKKKQDKTRISNEIVNLVKRSGGRFMKEKTRGGKLCEVADKDARVKVAQALRHRIRLCDGDKQEASFGMFSFAGLGGGNSAAVEDRLGFDFEAYRDAISGRTDDTEPIVSGRTDATRDVVLGDNFSPMSSEEFARDFGGLLGAATRPPVEATPAPQESEAPIRSADLGNAAAPAPVPSYSGLLGSASLAVAAPPPQAAPATAMPPPAPKSQHSEDDLDKAIAGMADDLSLSNISAELSSLDLSDHGSTRSSPMSVVAM